MINKENTGRLTQGIHAMARRIVFGDSSDEAVDAELRNIVHVDRAHLVMLVETGLVPRAAAAAILREIDDLRAANFAPLHGRPAPRGIFLLYESYLIEQLGPEVGGILQTGRSRNDLNAAILRLRLRPVYLELLRELSDLLAALIRRAYFFGDVVMPAYTHFQPAVPITYGHYLAGVAQALTRDIDAILQCSTDLDRSPLGAGAGGGTPLAIDPRRTASLLGFARPSLHSLDAVASRDLVLRLLSSTAILGVTLSRLATDLLQWTTAEFGFLELPDELSGSSSLMPQKKNPFLLEHIQGRSAQALGAFQAAAIAMHAKPFTNSIAVGTEGVAPVWEALHAVADSATLARLIVDGAQPDPARMLQQASAGYTNATEIANWLVLQRGISFRSAHQFVGNLVRRAVERQHVPIVDVIDSDDELRRAVDALHPTVVARSSDYGGGAGAAARASVLSALRTTWCVQADHRNTLARRWHAADELLAQAVQQILAGDYTQELSTQRRKGIFR